MFESIVLNAHQQIEVRIMTMKNTVHLLPQTNHLRALHSIIRDKNACQNEFVFYSNQIIRLLLETASNMLPFHPKNVMTPIGEMYEGLESTTKLCAVSVIRAGESMETELRSMHLNAPLGKILIQRDKQTKLPKFYYSNLPSDIDERHVFLLEPMLATAGSALMGIKVLLDAGVKEENIIFINILIAPEGLERVSETHPKIRIVTSSVEKELNENAFMVPGIGDFGDRYFGTTDSGAR